MRKQNEFKKIQSLIKRRLLLEQRISVINSMIANCASNYQKLGDGIYRISYDKETGIEERVKCYPKIEFTTINHKQ